MADKPTLKPIGKVTHYFDRAQVAVVALEKGKKLNKGDGIAFKGSKTDFSQSVDSIQVDLKDVESVKAGDDFGLKVDQPVREGDSVLPAK